MRSQNDLELFEPSWRGVVTRLADETKLIGVTDEHVLIVLCSDKSDVRAQLEPRKDEIIEKLKCSA